jgi:hypothetical protein
MHETPYAEQPGEPAVMSTKVSREDRMCEVDARSLLAPLKHADERQECLLLAVERKGPADGRSGAVDSAETAGLQELMPITNRSLI